MQNNFTKRFRARKGESVGYLTVMS